MLPLSISRALVFDSPLDLRARPEATAPRKRACALLLALRGMVLVDDGEHEHDEHDQQNGDDQPADETLGDHSVSIA